MRYRFIIASFLMAASLGAISPATADSQSLSIDIPKVTLFNVDPPVPFSFEKGADVATGSSKLAISSNVPDARLQIIASGVTLRLTSDAIQCPHQSGRIITCKVGVKLIRDGTLNFTATRIREDIEPSISYVMFP
jgi:hypothetical protein